MMTRDQAETYALAIWNNTQYQQEDSSPRLAIASSILRRLRQGWEPYQIAASINNIVPTGRIMANAILTGEEQSA